jgi:hypothetical protein
LIVLDAVSETTLAARTAILEALAGRSGSITISPKTVAEAFPGIDRAERCETMLYWAETNGLEVKSHPGCDADELCEEWPCGPIDFETMAQDIK